MDFKKRKRIFSLFTAVILIAGSLLNPAVVFAEEDGGNSGERDYRAEAEARKGEPVQSNEIDNWPRGPQVGAEGAIVMEVNTGAILYAKNIDEHLYPASTTKVLTTLVAMEHTQDLNEMVKFSTEAVFGIERGSSNMGMDVGQSITMEQCLYGILVYSANEVCNAVAEHIAGSIDGFVEMMNQTALSLGATHTHFMNAHGLTASGHYTCAYDIYLMLNAAMKYDLFMDIIQRKNYYAEYTDADGDAYAMTWKTTDHYLTAEAAKPSNVVIYGGKTGTTEDAGACLALISKDLYGNPFISVILHSDSKDTLYPEMNQVLSLVPNS